MRYRSHKEVDAYKIATVQEATSGGIALTFEDAEPKEVDAKLGVRYMPVPGDYLVVYNDGYESFSPGKAFEEGYTLLGATG